jgi:molybdate transport system substrate-binding protein
MPTELKVLSSNGVKGILRELGPVFEQGSSMRLTIELDAAAILKRKIEDGAAFDLTILTADIADELIKTGKLLGGTRTNIARSGVGVGVRGGAPKPDIGTTEALKRALLDARSVAYTTRGASGQYFAGLLEILGIADRIRAKAKTMPGGIVAELVARGEAELAVQQISELMTVSGVEVAGPLPPELQTYTTFTAAVSASAKEPAAARAFIKFLSAPEALPLIKAKGMEPPG